MIIIHDRRRSTSTRPSDVILVQQFHLPQVGGHRSRRHQREPCVYAVVRELVGKRAQEEASKRASETSARGLSLAIVETPGSHVEGREVSSIEPISSR